MAATALFGGDGLFHGVEFAAVFELVAEEGGEGVAGAGEGFVFDFGAVDGASDAGCQEFFAEAFDDAGEDGDA